MFNTASAKALNSPIFSPQKLPASRPSREIPNPPNTYGGRTFRKGSFSNEPLEIRGKQILPSSSSPGYPMPPLKRVSAKADLSHLLPNEGRSKPQESLRSFTPSESSYTLFLEAKRIESPQ
ncbi:MAG: hypothetical protein ACQEP8_01585 [Chlamydiota bacterium]